MSDKAMTDDEIVARLKDGGTCIVPSPSEEQLMRIAGVIERPVVHDSETGELRVPEVSAEVLQAMQADPRLQDFLAGIEEEENE